MSELLLIRHAASDNGGKLAGRLDVDAILPKALPRLRAERAFTSPLRRCRQTAAALGLDAIADARLREQNFGEWEGTIPPDLGVMDRQEIALLTPPGGENFLAVAARVAAALAEITAGGNATLVAHAGSIRAALGLALGDAAQGLAFEIAPLSATALRLLPGGAWSIGFVNQALA